MMKLISLFAVIAVASAASVKFQPRAGFEYLGSSDGKNLISPILSEEEKYGMTWTDAIKRCTDAGYRMATITTPALNELVKAYVLRDGDEYIVTTNWVWIDGLDIYNNKTYISVNTGETLNSQLSFWSSDSSITPNDDCGQRESCLIWFYTRYTKGWGSSLCTDKRDVVCEAILG